jgi:hypothetical protein
MVWESGLVAKGAWLLAKATLEASGLRVIIEGGHDFHPRRSPVFIEGGHPFS